MYVICQLVDDIIDLLFLSNSTGPRCLKDDLRKSRASYQVTKTANDLFVVSIRGLPQTWLQLFSI